MSIQFYVDPATDSNELEYMPGTRGIARHHDPRDNVWQIEDNGERAARAERPWED
ncbi:MAG: hypothetical protein ACI8PG_001150 [Planctomycetota bacterium]